MLLTKKMYQQQLCSMQSHIQGVTGCKGCVVRVHISSFPDDKAMHVQLAQDADKGPIDSRVGWIGGKQIANRERTRRTAIQNLYTHITYINTKEAL